MAKLSLFDRRRRRVRTALKARAGGRPRLSVHRSGRHIYAQIIDDAQGRKLKLQLGYSHDVDLDVPEGLEVKTPDQTTVEVSGIDKQAVGQFAAEIRRWRKPEPYKGKGIAYRGEYIFRKEGKKK